MAYANTTENEKNPIPEDLKKEIDVNDKSEILVDKRDNIVDEGKQLGKNTKGSYEYIDYYVKDRPKNLTFNYNMIRILLKIWMILYL